MIFLQKKKIKFTKRRGAAPRVARRSNGSGLRLPALLASKIELKEPEKQNQALLALVE